MAADPRRFLHRRGAEVALLPLRAFLGATFVFAGLQKLSDPRFFDAGAASSIQTQLRASQRTSPVGSVLHGAAHLAVLMGVVIALMEIAVGLGALLGLWTKWAAAGGAALSAGFLLAVSWHAHPYYYGSDIVFLFAWTPLLIGGAGVFSVDALLRDRARRDLSIPPFGPVEIDFGVVRKLCGAYDAGRCNQRGGAPCAVEPCPVLARQVVLKPAVRDELDRRAFLLRARTVGGIGAATLVLGGATAVLGRLFAPARKETLTPKLSTHAAPTTTTPVPATGDSGPTSAPSASPPSTVAHPAGTAIGPASAVPVGSAASFTDPSNGDPAYVLQPRGGQFFAVNAVCTHAGCTVSYQSPNTLVCPCHGAEFDASTGAVLRGPARTPLPMIPISPGSDGQLYVQA
ncbi:MAG: Rieske 2Fe-2S domain-containing protein [Acidimicrobiia bacterium]